MSHNVLVTLANKSAGQKIFFGINCCNFFWEHFRVGQQIFLLGQLVRLIFTF